MDAYCMQLALRPFITQAPSKVDAVMQLPGNVAREQTALAHTRGGVASHGMDQHPDASSQPSVTTLRQNPGDRAGENVAGTGARHARITSLAQSRCPALHAYEGASALQHYGATISPNEPLERGKPVCLHFVRTHIE